MAALPLAAPARPVLGGQCHPLARDAMTTVTVVLKAGLLREPYSAVGKSFMARIFAWIDSRSQSLNPRMRSHWGRDASRSRAFW